MTRISPSNITKPADRLRDGRFLLAVFFHGNPMEGGGYTHKVGTLRVLHRMQTDAVRIIVICDSAEAHKTAKSHGLNAIIQRPNVISRMLGRFSESRIVKLHFGRSLGPMLSSVDRMIRRVGADLVYFPSPDRRALQLFSRGYIFSVFDLAHLEHPEFPEVSLFGEFERRENLYASAVRKAVAVVVDSQEGRRLIAEQYRVPSERIFAAPFLMSVKVDEFVPNEETSVKLRSKYGIKPPYIFYPAQFWAHKNHRYIVDALRVLRDHYGWAPQAVFCGADKGTLGGVLEAARDSGVIDLIKYCGFVPEEDIPYLYAGSLALVMPTYFGPTNIPPREALRLGVPVCYSDFPAFREFLGDCVNYVRLDDPTSLADALHRLRTEQSNGRAWGDLREGAKRDMAEEETMRVLETIIQQFRRKVRFDCGI